MNTLLESPTGVAYAVAAVLIAGWLIYSRLFGGTSGAPQAPENDDVVEPRRRLPLE